MRPCSPEDIPLSSCLVASSQSSLLLLLLTKPPPGTPGCVFERTYGAALVPRTFGVMRALPERGSPDELSAMMLRLGPLLLKLLPEPEPR